MHTSRRASGQANLLAALAIAVVDRLHQARADDDGRGLTATAALNQRLETEGLVERRPGGDDARSRALVLTDAGQRAALAAARKRLEILDQMLSSLTAAERRQLEPVIEKLLSALTSDRGKPPPVSTDRNRTRSSDGARIRAPPSARA